MGSESQTKYKSLATDLELVGFTEIRKRPTPRLLLKPSRQTTHRFDTTSTSNLHVKKQIFGLTSHMNFFSPTYGSGFSSLWFR